MPHWKIGLDLAGLQLSFSQALQFASNAGLDAVEIDARGPFRPSELSRTGVREIRKMLEGRNLSISTVSYRTRRGYSDPTELDPRIAATKAAMQMAYDLGARAVVARIGRVPQDPQSDLRRLLIDVLTDLGRHGQRVGAMLAAETATESGPELAKLLAELPHGTLGVDLNPAELILGGFSACEAVEALGRHIVHVHAADAVDESSRGPARRVPLGQGSADFPALLGALVGFDYRGVLTLQLSGAESPQAEIARAVRYLRPS